MNRYEEAVRWLYGLEAARGMDFKLERVELALEALGAPQRNYPCIHVGGTNGKGSVSAICQGILAAAGHRTGLYTSPHLVRLTERVRIGDEEIEPEVLVELVDEIRRLVSTRGIDLTFFEFLTVLAFQHFSRSNVDAAVVEVGLGGRLDATNVVDPEVAVVTTIGMDHQEWLGTTLGEIAREKGGILKPGRAAVFGRLRPEAESVLNEIAAGRGCPLSRLGRDFSLTADDPAEFRGRAGVLEGLSLPLRGAHQRDNAAVALAAIEAVAGVLPAPPVAIRDGLARVHWPGRFEIVGASPMVILDCAHNPDGIDALVAEMGRVAAGRRVHLLFAVMRDKDWSTMARRVAAVAETVTISALPPRGEEPDRIAEVFAPLRPTRVIAEPVLAFEQVLRDAAPDDVVLVTGSLFLVGAVQPAAERLRAISPAQPVQAR